jgi:anthranilate/para-aminobenzoate synthase component II
MILVVDHYDSFTCRAEHHVYITDEKTIQKHQ